MSDFVELRKVTRGLRKKSTGSETVFWEAVRGRKFMGRKFVRQYAIPFEYRGERRFFVADFFCKDEALVVEIDGPVHERQQDYDSLRTAIINQLGINVVRFTNEEIDHTLPEVLTILRERMKS